MQESAICKSRDHLFLPILEVHDPLLRCVHCNVFAYQETVKQLAKTKAYGNDEAEADEPAALPNLNRFWPVLLKACFGFLSGKSPSPSRLTGE
jgi:hypothetical protein